MIYRALLMVLLLGQVFAGGVAAKPAARPNVVILLSDDLGYKDLGYSGGPVVTPVLDRLAREGTTFTDFYSGCAVCSPSRATLLTGRHHIRAGVYSWIQDDEHKSHLLEREVTIAEILKANGYATGHFGKWHLGLPFGKFKSKPTPDKHGFDYWFVTANNATPSHRNPNNFIRNGKPLGPIQGYSCQIVVDEAIGWMNSRKEKDKPFFLNLWFHEPHYPLAAPPELVKEYGNPDAEAAIYSATIANTDLAIGRLVAKLAQDGTLDNTLVIYASDNGSYRRDRVGNLRAQKGSNFEGGIRVPGFFCWPGTIPGDTSVEQPAGLVDILPTLCGLLGIACPEGVHLDGTSLVPLLTGKAEDFKRAQPLFWHLQKSRPIVAMRDGNYSLVADPAYKLSERNMFNEQWIPLIRKGGYTNFRLYDLSKDPGQQHDLAKAYPEVLARLKKKLLKINASIMQDGTDWSKKRPLAGLGD